MPIAVSIKTLEEVLQHIEKCVEINKEKSHYVNKDTQYRYYYAGLAIGLQDAVDIIRRELLDK